MGRPFRYTEGVMATIRLKKIIDYRGVVYGPGEIEVSDTIADTLVQYYDAERVETTATPSEPPVTPVTTADVTGATMVGGQMHVIVNQQENPNQESGEPFPDDFHAKEKLAEAGVTTWEQLKALPELPGALTDDEKELVKLEMAVKYDGQE